MRSANLDINWDCLFIRICSQERRAGDVVPRVRRILYSHLYQYLLVLTAAAVSVLLRRSSLRTSRSATNLPGPMTLTAWIPPQCLPYIHPCSLTAVSPSASYSSPSIWILT
ncbi:hypothetical protein L226DRAFT_204915 [Lentinus tigrinus ALCF2SS1-7]|uniref:uncharacterized protein n=1 Tax=Lentinus tigrinus ALCF2SS1-7 TaxID=1328758 RepID=UPI001165F047|nr:hypothetical protein L226DRAFT_204915 [Lentinus tigrinus ALCF2SS1-7]